MVLIFSSQPLFAQSFGDTYESVMANLREYQAQHAMDTYIDSQIFPSWKEDEIMTGTRLYGSVTSIFITKYYFHNNKYIKMVSVSDAGNASNMLAWTINEQTKSLGKHTIFQGNQIK